MDNSIKVKAALGDTAALVLHEAAGELARQAARNTPAGAGQLKSSWDYSLNAGKNEARIGSPLEEAIWNEFGSGEYTLRGDGRKNDRTYRNGKGQYQGTVEKKPQRSLWNAYQKLKAPVIKKAEQRLKERMK